MNVRNAEDAEIDHIARIWYDGWQGAHASILPKELARFRTLESFTHRLRAALPRVRVLDVNGEPAGFYMIKDDELYQFYVAAAARGTGAAAILMSDAEARLSKAAYTPRGWHGRSEMSVPHGSTRNADGAARELW